MAAETTSRRSQEESTSRRTQEETVSRRTQEETSRISLFPLDIFEMDGCIYIYAELPGISKENISIDIYNEKLTIIANKPKKYHELRKPEIYYGRFKRTVSLPICVTKPETVTRKLENGVLIIKINKHIEEQNRFTLDVTDETDKINKEKLDDTHEHHEESDGKE